MSRDPHAGWFWIGRHVTYPGPPNAALENWMVGTLWAERYLHEIDCVARRLASKPNAHVISLSWVGMI